MRGEHPPDWSAWRPPGQSAIRPSHVVIAPLRLSAAPDTAFLSRHSAISPQPGVTKARAGSRGAPKRPKGRFGSVGRGLVMRIESNPHLPPLDKRRVSQAKRRPLFVARERWLSDRQRSRTSRNPGVPTVGNWPKATVHLAKLTGCFLENRLNQGGSSCQPPTPLTSIRHHACDTSANASPKLPIDNLTANACRRVTSHA